MLPTLDTQAAGDVLVALGSSGPHSNGYSLVRRVVERSGWKAKYGKLPPYRGIGLGIGAQAAGGKNAANDTSAALLNANWKPTEKDVVETLSGNVCRCGTHPRILAAVRSVALKRGSK